ncbi:MAG: DUF6452 family protein [Prevotella sp.]|nr:DUF6452 family protein [Bacteroides sp.]MCM1366321.1 DUF6452 family protein [Prevotella sp.]MCM1437125.1 DUF6452 family protein [Prevotella sp.]
MIAYTRHIIILLTGVLLLFSSCATEECLDNKNSLPLAGFYSSSVTPQPIQIDSISLQGVGAPGDSLVLDNSQGVSQTFLPFRIDHDETTFHLIYNFTATEKNTTPLYDIVTFKYDISPLFVSSACGVIYQYKVKEINSTKLYIDSVTCPAGIIDNTPGQNIFFYFRVADEEGGGE